MTSLDAEFADHAPFLRALARRVAADGDAAEDLVQDTFLAALVRGPREHDGLLPWLSTVVRRIGSNRRRGNARRRDREERRADSAVGVDASVAAGEIEVARRLLAHVEALAEPYRTAVFLRYYEDLPPREIAARTGAPVATVRTRLARALAQLRVRLDADDERGREAWLSSALALGGVGGARATKAAGIATVVGGALLVAAAVTFAVLIRGDVPSATHTAGVDVEMAGSSATLAAPDVPTPVAEGARSRAALASPRETFTCFVEDAAIGGEPGTGRPAVGVEVEVWVSGSPMPAATPPPNVDGAESDFLVMRRGAPTTRRLAETDAAGAFVLSLPSGAVVERVVAHASAGMREARWHRDRAPADSVDDEPLRITRFPTGTLVGRVVDPEGSAIGGARVTLSHWEGEQRVSREAYSDANGHFAITETHDGSWLRAEHEDWLLVGATRPSKGRLGGWNDAEIVMSRAGTLELEIVDAGGRASTDVPVFLGALEGEVGTDWSRFDIGARIEQELLVADGRAAIRVPSDVALVFTAGASYFDRMHDGVAIPRNPSASGDDRIVVPNSGTLSLRAVLGVDVVLRGTVLDPNGELVTDAEVELKPRDDRFGPYYERLTTLEDGTFETRIASGYESLTLHVTARSPGARPGSRTSPLIATREVEVSGLHPQSVEIRMEPSYDRAIRGRVLDERGDPAQATVLVQCVDADDGEIARAGWSLHLTNEEGTFESGALPRGQYRLSIRGHEGAARVIEDVRPGGDLLEVTLSERTAARLRIHVSEEVSRLDVVVARLEPESEANAEDSIDLAHARSPFVWAAHGRTVRPEGRVWIERHFVDVELGCATLALAPGRVWIGVTGRGADFRPLSTVSSGLVRIEPEADIDVQAALLPTVAASGRVVAGNALRIALVDEEGRFFRATASRNAERRGQRSFETGRHGHFALSEVPIGPWEVWVGTRDELDRRSPRHREPVVAREGERLEITIEL
ncbi:MAG: sigma-70 family RNA polymerase sigma factor [Planctomycetota bacterium]